MDVYLGMKILVYIAISTAALRVILTRDYLPKVTLMAIALSFLYAINDQHHLQVDYFIWLATTGAFWYVIVLGLAVKIATVVSKSNLKDEK
jgi:hypothetical protein